MENEPLELHCYVNNIGVRSYIPTGAPFAYKTTNISVLDLFASDHGLQHILAANNLDFLTGIDDLVYGPHGVRERD